VKVENNRTFIPVGKQQGKLKNETRRDEKGKQDI